MLGFTLAHVYFSSKKPLKSVHKRLANYIFWFEYLVVILKMVDRVCGAWVGE